MIQTVSIMQIGLVGTEHIQLVFDLETIRSPFITLIHAMLYLKKKKKSNSAVTS